MEMVGYFASLLIGISLGLIGGGGSILTIPVLVYLFGISPTLAISYSLFIVGTTSLAGALNNYLKKQVDIPTAFIFGSASITTVFICRKFVIPRLPEVFFVIGDFTVTHSLFVMVMFAALMVAASFSMIKDKKVEPGSFPNKRSGTLKLITYGVLIGLGT